MLEAANSQEALTILAARIDVHIIFTDVDLPPGPNGFELAREVARRWPGIEILISSGRRWPDAGDLPTGPHSLRSLCQTRSSCRKSRQRQSEHWQTSGDSRAKSTLPSSPSQKQPSAFDRCPQPRAERSSNGMHAAEPGADARAGVPAESPTPTSTRAHPSTKSGNSPTWGRPISSGNRPREVP